MNENLVAKLRAVKVRTPEEIMAQYDQKFSVEDILNGRTFYGDARDYDGNRIGIKEALQKASNYVGDKGIIVTMPELIAARCRAGRSHTLRQAWYAVHSEENIGIDRDGRFYSRSEPVLVVVHGGGLLTPARIQQAYGEGLAHGSARYTQEEFDALLRGELLNGDSLELYSYEDIESGVSGLPHRFGVVVPYALARGTISGSQTRQQFLKNPLVIARNAGKENLEEYFEKAKCSDKKMGSWHVYSGSDATQPQGRVLYFKNSYIDLNGLDGNVGLNSDGYFIGVVRGNEE